jgi:hypothetical protein
MPASEQKKSQAKSCEPYEKVYNLQTKSSLQLGTTPTQVPGAEQKLQAPTNFKRS